MSQLGDEDDPGPPTPPIAGAGAGAGPSKLAQMFVAPMATPSRRRRSVSIGQRGSDSEDEVLGKLEAEREEMGGLRRNRDLPEEERLIYSDSESIDEDGEMSGAAKAEAAQAVWGTTSRWFLFLGIGMSAYIYSLDSSTTYQYLYFATSTVLKHSLSGTLTTAQAIIIAVGKPLMAKLSDVIGRAETFITVTILYVIGYVIIATAQHIDQIALGEIVYAFGYTGLQILQQIVIADMTTLRYRGLVTGLISAPFIINQFVAAEILERVLPNWRWGYLMFAILVPISLVPLILALLWGQHKARRRMTQAYRKTAHNGLFLIAASLALILLPLGLAPTAKDGWKNPTMPAMMVVGTFLVPVFVWYECRFPRSPVVPMRWLRKGPILGACLIGLFDFASFYLQGTYLYSYIYVTRAHWTYREITYFTATQMMTMTIFGIIGGLLMAATKRFKYMLFTGLLIRLLGVILMIDARSSTGTTPQLISCQVLQGIGGGFASIAVQVSAQAAVSHMDVATVTALVLLLTEVGNSVGSALAAGVWATYMPRELMRFVGGLPGVDQALLDELFGSIMDITLYEPGDPIRKGAVLAYQAVMYKLVLGAIFLALFPPIICLWLTHDIRLTRAQNAVENTDLAGRAIPEVADEEPERLGGNFTGERRGSVRLRNASSPARRVRMSASVGSGFGRGPSHMGGVGRVNGNEGELRWDTLGRDTVRDVLGRKRSLGEGLGIGYEYGGGWRGRGVGMGFEDEADQGEAAAGLDRGAVGIGGHGNGLLGVPRGG